MAARPGWTRRSHSEPVRPGATAPTELQATLASSGASVAVPVSAAPSAAEHAPYTPQKNSAPAGLSLRSGA